MKLFNKINPGNVFSQVGFSFSSPRAWLRSLTAAKKSSQLLPPPPPVHPRKGGDASYADKLSVAPRIEIIKSEKFELIRKWVSNSLSQNFSHLKDIQKEIEKQTVTLPFTEALKSRISTDNNSIKTTPDFMHIIKSEPALLKSVSSILTETHKLSVSNDKKTDHESLKERREFWEKNINEFVRTEMDLVFARMKSMNLQVDFTVFYYKGYPHLPDNIFEACLTIEVLTTAIAAGQPQRKIGLNFSNVEETNSHVSRNAQIDSMRKSVKFLRNSFRQLSVRRPTSTTFMTSK